MERHVRRSAAPELDDQEDRIPDFDTIAPLLSPPLIFRNGKIVSRRAEIERAAAKPPIGIRPKRRASR